MKDCPAPRQTGAVSRVSAKYRTLTGGHFSADRTQRIACQGLLPEDLKILQASTEPLKYLFPCLDWDQWGIEIVEGHDHLVEVLFDEQTLVIERNGLGELALLSWDVYGAFLRTILQVEYGEYLTPHEIPLYAMIAQLQWFQTESCDWQYEMLASLALPNMDQLDLAGLLWSLLPTQRASRLEVLLRDQALPRTSRSDDMNEQHACWAAANEYLNRHPSNLNDETPSPYPPQATQKDVPDVQAQLKKIDHLFSICSLISWTALCGPLPGLLARYIYEIPADTNSTDRRLGLFRVCIEQTISQDQLNLRPHNWPHLSLAVLDANRHPRIHQALIQYQSVINSRDPKALWEIRADENQLDQLALRNQLSEQDDRFFRQATHLQAIWRDVLHRSASQQWSAELLYNALELLIGSIQDDPDLFFAAVIWNQDLWETSKNPIALPLQNLRELLWILSQAPLSTLRILYPQDAEQATTAKATWPLLHNHLRRFLHLAPTTLQELLEQIEDETNKQPQQENTLEHIQFDADREIPQQDLKGRIVPLLSRSEMLQHRWINLEQTKALRIIHLDHHLHKSSGKIRGQRFFSSFLFFFKTEQDEHEGGWNELALWIDKDLDLGKLASKRTLSPTIRGLLLEDGIWERTYRYQFLTMDQLLKKLKPGCNEWRSLLRLLCHEYRPLFEQRLQELLDYQFYMTKGRVLGPNALTAQLENEELHPLLRLSIEEFEAIKHQLAKRIAEKGLQAFEAMQSQDDRCWQHAHQTIAQTVRKMSLLLHLPPGSLFLPLTESETNNDCREWTWKVLQQWTDNPDEFTPSPIHPESWIQDKIALLLRLERIHPTGAIKFTTFLLNQVKPEYRLVQLLLDCPLEEGKQLLFKPIPTNNEYNNQKTLTPYLKDASENLFSPTFLNIISRIPSSLMRETIERNPQYLPALQKTAGLLREIDPDNEHVITLTELLDELKHIRPPEKTGRQEQIPTHNDLLERSQSS